MADAENTALEMRPEPLNAVGGYVAVGELLRPVVDDGVDVALACKTIVLICKDAGVISHELHNDGLERLGLCVLNVECDHVAVSFGHTEDGALGLQGASLRMLHLLGLVFVGLTATKVHLIHLHVAHEGLLIVLSVEGAYLLLDVPYVTTRC